MFRSILYVGACNIIMKFFDPAATLQLVQDEKVTHLMIVPTHLIAMLAVEPYRHLTIAVERRPGILSIDQFHQLQIERCFACGLPVESGAVETE